MPEGLDLDVTTGARDQDLTGRFGTVRVELGSGDLFLTRAQARALSGRIDTGDVQVQGSVPAVRITGKPGEVDAALDALTAEVLTSSTTGDVQVLVPYDETRYDTTALSDTGEAQVSAPAAGAPAPRLTAVTETAGVVVRVR
ncbi:DUF4097 family beta strand repeat-containing protein [Kineococcus sp. SYSU DK002]|uniref:DUF4097 family beta strand repeat-containing protein n=1 Tax=Kineococcus sp. SYSU DK002 TaxID=3383123 RepID=UPI003D7D5381